MAARPSFCAADFIVAARAVTIGIDENPDVDNS